MSQDKIQVSSQEVAFGADINQIQQYTGNILSQLLLGMLSGDVEGLDRASVVGGYRVSIATPYSAYTISAGVAFQGAPPSALESGDFPIELMVLNSGTSVPATAPGIVGRYDVVEMRAKPRTVTNATRPFYSPSLGTVSDQSTPKNVRSIPEFRVRTNVLGASVFDVEWIPLAVVEVYNTFSGVPTFVVHDCRPMFRQRNSLDADGQLYGEVGSPASNADGYDNALMCGGSVMFDGKLWPLPPQGTLLRSLLEYGTVLTASPAQQQHYLYIAKPEATVRYSPDIVQYVLSRTPPDRNGVPSADLQLHGPCPGVITRRAAHIETLILSPAPDGFAIMQPHALAFRRAGSHTSVGSADALFEGEIGCVIGTRTVTVILSWIPANVSTVRMVLYLVNEFAYAAVTKIGFATDHGGLAAVTSFQKFGMPLIARGAVVVDAPVVRGGPGVAPRVIIQGDQDFKIHYQVIGWNYAPGNVVSTQG